MWQKYLHVCSKILRYKHIASIFYTCLTRSLRSVRNKGCSRIVELFQTIFVRTTKPNTGIPNVAVVFADTTEDKLQLRMPYYFSFPVALRPNSGHVLLIHEHSRSHSTTHRTRWYPSGRVISSSLRPLPDITRHSQQTNIHVPCGIRTHDRSRRAAVDLRPRPRGYWDRHVYLLRFRIMVKQ